MFNKLKLFSLLLIGSLVIGVSVVGCGQETPEVKTIQAVPENLVLKGIVYTRYYYYEGGYSPGHNYDYQRGEPVVGAVVTLTGSFETRTAITNSAGEYVFENFPYGDYTMVVSKEGYQTTEYSTYFGTLQAEMPLVDGTIQTRDVEISTHPVIRSITPVPESTIETTSSFTIVFNEPMDTSTVRPRIASGGVRTSAAGDNPSVSSAWSNNDTVLTITPNGTLLPNQNYQLYLADAFENIKDKAGYILAVGNYSDRVRVYENGAYINVEVINSELSNYIRFKTVTGGVPGAPTGLQLQITDVTAILPEDLDYINLNDGFEGVVLNWQAPDSGEVSGYKIYVSKGSTGPWHLIMDASTGGVFVLGDVSSNTLVVEVDDINYSIYRASIQTGMSYPGGIDPVGMGNAMFINDKACFKVVAYNGEGESSAITAEAQDATAPILSVLSYNGVVDLTLTNGYVLPALPDDTYRYIGFQEPVDLADAGDFDNYSIIGGSITSVQVMTSDMLNIDPGIFGGVAYTIVRIQGDVNLTGDILTVDNVNDLAGNTSTGLTVGL